MKPLPPSSGVESRGSRIAFWGFAWAGIFAMTLVWAWFGLAVYEERSDQSKALAAGTTMNGFAATVGGIPIVLAHLIGLILLIILGSRVWGAKGIGFAVVAVAAVSVIGLGIAQFIFEGRVFEFGKVITP